MADGSVLRVGDVLYGFCGGAFGRDSYEDKRVEAIGTDWVVARGTDGAAVFARYGPDELVEYLMPPEEDGGEARWPMNDTPENHDEDANAWSPISLDSRSGPTTTRRSDGEGERHDR